MRKTALMGLSALLLVFVFSVTGQAEEKKTLQKAPAKVTDALSKKAETTDTAAKKIVKPKRLKNGIYKITHSGETMKAKYNTATGFAGISGDLPGSIHIHMDDGTTLEWGNKKCDPACEKGTYCVDGQCIDE